MSEKIEVFLGMLIGFVIVGVLFFLTLRENP
jgi:hypothetical protein